MTSNTLRVDGPFVIGQICAPSGTLGNPAAVDIFLDGVKTGIALADKTAAPPAPGRAARLSSFEFRLPHAAPLRGSPVISAQAPTGAAFGFTAWNAGARRMARWLEDVEDAFARAASAQDIVSIASDFRRFAKWRPDIVLRSQRAAAAIVRDLAIALCATDGCREAARLLSAFPLFLCLRSGDAALFEALRVIADEADWRDKRRLAALLAIGSSRSAMAGAMARRMRLSRSRPASQADAVWLRRVMDNADTSAALRAFAAETLALHTAAPLTGPL